MATADENDKIHYLPTFLSNELTTEQKNNKKTKQNKNKTKKQKTIDILKHYYYFVLLINQSDR